jgi:hypothetical protein
VALEREAGAEDDPAVLAGHHAALPLVHAPHVIAQRVPTVVLLPARGADEEGGSFAQLTFPRPALSGQPVLSVPTVFNIQIKILYTIRKSLKISLYGVPVPI